MCLLHFCSWPVACGDHTVAHHLSFIHGVLKIAHKFPFHPQSCLPNRLVFLAKHGALHLPKQHDWRKTSPVQQSPTEFMIAWFKQALPVTKQFHYIPTNLVFPVSQHPYCLLLLDEERKCQRGMLPLPPNLQACLIYILSIPSLSVIEKHHRTIRSNPIGACFLPFPVSSGLGSSAFTCLSCSSSSCLCKIIPYAARPNAPIVSPLEG